MLTVKMKMLVITLFAATLVVASGAWPSENFQPTDASLQGEFAIISLQSSSVSYILCFVYIGTQEMENDAMDAGYPEYFRGQ